MVEIITGYIWILLLTVLLMDVMEGWYNGH